MTPQQSYELNQSAVKKLKPMIDKEYAAGRFVALHGGQIIVDAATIEDLHAAVAARGLNGREVLALQAGFEQPEYAIIL